MLRRCLQMAALAGAVAAAWQGYGSSGMALALESMLSFCAATP